MYHRAGFGEAGERSYPGRCNPHAWLKSGAIQPAKWYPFPRAEIFAPPAPGSPFAVSPIRAPGPIRATLPIYMQFLPWMAFALAAIFEVGADSVIRLGIRNNTIILIELVASTLAGYQLIAHSTDC